MKTRTIKELGDTQRCSKCNKYAKMIKLTVWPKKSKAKFLCESCLKNFEVDYSTRHFHTRTGS